MLEDIIQESRTLLESNTVPDEKRVLDLLQRCRRIVDIALSDKHPINLSKRVEVDATSSLLDLENGNTKVARKSPPTDSKGKSFRQRASTSISSILLGLVRDPNIFLSPQVLAQYTEIQCLLKDADYIPEVFSLYATKPAPQARGSKIVYHKTNPHSAKNAIPKELADRALEVALEQKNMPLALEIIDKSFCTPAFKRAKILRKAGLPIAGMIAAPPAAWMAASYIAALQSTMAPTTATWMAFSAIMTYLGVTSSVGLVAIATANDHMERVSWLPGMALRQRWLREEEREAMDKIAQAWGFKDPSMRGEEEGEDWENLRELLGMRGMVLDKTDLMEGME
ncbi:hypothetical protein VTO42DRAFT_1476 [Malbranchea cinnamomea]